MNLPNYFLADLPPEATLSPVMITEACQTLKRNREHYLATRSTESLVKTLSRVADGWLEPDNAFRKQALELGPAQTGFSRENPGPVGWTIFSAGSRATIFTRCSCRNSAMSKRLDALCATPVEQKQNRMAILNAPEFQVHIAAGNIPNPTLASMVFGMLTRSAQLVKCASGSSLLPRLFAHSIYEFDPKLGACLEVAEWRGGTAALENALFGEADCVTATGSDETLAAIRTQLPAKTRFLGYGHRVSFAFVAGEDLFGSSAKKIVARAADDVVAWNQLGCLSPHVIYVQLGGEVSPDQFAGLLADELDRREKSEPRGELPVELAATIASRRGIYEIRAAHSPRNDAALVQQGSTAWTVVYEADARFQMSCLNRFIYVKAVADLTAMLQGADDIRGKVSTVGIAVPEDKAQEIATQLARWGATRVCPLGQMQNPPLTWRHDGRAGVGRFGDVDGL